MIPVSVRPGRHNVDDQVLVYWPWLCCVKEIFGFFTRHAQV